MSDRTFEYLLNAMEHAAQSKNPAKAGYAGKRQRVLDYVAELQRTTDELRVSAAAESDVIGWLERHAGQELRIHRIEDGRVQVDRWHRRYVSYFAFAGRTLREAVKHAIAAELSDERR